MSLRHKVPFRTEELPVDKLGLEIDSRDRSFIASGTGEKGALTSSWFGAPAHRTATTSRVTAVGGCVRARECVHVCASVCVRDMFAIYDNNI